MEHQLVCHSVRHYKLGTLSSTWRTVEQQQVSNKFGNGHFCHTVEDRFNLMRSDLSVLYTLAATGRSWNWQKHWTQQQPKRCYFTSHRFSLFITVSLLSVVLRPEEGVFPENLHCVVCVIINKRSFESFMCLDLKLTGSSKGKVAISNLATQDPCPNGRCWMGDGCSLSVWTIPRFIWNGQNICPSLISLMVSVDIKHHVYL